MKADYTIPNFSRNPLDKKALLQKWARAYFADHLREKGFVSWRGEDLSWYKLVNNEVLLTVYLFNSSPYWVLFPCLGYGTHAPFVRPAMPEKITLTDCGGANTEQHSAMLFDTPQRPMADDIPVMQTAAPDGGYRKFEETLWPMMSRIQTLDDAYQPFRKRYIEVNERRNRETPEYAGQSAVATMDFMDEAIWLNDTEMMDYCANDLKLFYANSYHRKERPRIEKQMDAVYYGKRDEYLRYLEQRKEKILRKLQKEAGLRIDL